MKTQLLCTFTTKQRLNEEIQERMKMLEEIDPDHPSLKKIKKNIKELEA